MPPSSLEGRTRDFREIPVESTRTKTRLSQVERSPTSLTLTGDRGGQVEKRPAKKNG